jgi:hypothetical protein
MRALALHATAGVIAAALPVGLVSAAGHVSRSQLAVPSELLQLVTPASPVTPERPRPGLPRHASAWPTPAVRRPAANVVIRHTGAALEVRPHSVEAVAPARHAGPEPPGVALAQPAIQPRSPEPQEAAPIPPLVVDVPEPHPVLPAPAPAPPPVAEAATAAPVAAPAAPVGPQPAPAPVAVAPVAPAVHHEDQEEHHEHDGDEEHHD